MSAVTETIEHIEGQLTLEGLKIIGNNMLAKDIDH
jgi:hypothetical protein